MDGLLFLISIVFSLWILRPVKGIFFQTWSEFDNIDSKRDFSSYIKTVSLRIKSPMGKLWVAYIICYLIFAIFSEFGGHNT